ncbi:MAG: FAD-dependent oxidoreductase, partial [Peptococcaceae bacterium]|nr:FAD-dependent oxidoreductase [Peptococcaceae bacterium]
MVGLNIVIIGNGAAGFAAAKTARKLSAGVAITLVGDEGSRPYSRARIPEVLAFGLGFERIIYQPGEIYRQYRIKPLHAAVARIYPDRHRILLEDGVEVPYDRLLVATGAAPVIPGLPGRELDGIFGFRSYADAVAVSRAAEGDTRAVVLGGGLVGLKAAFALKKRGVPKVDVIVKSPYPMTRQLDEEAGALVEKYFRSMGVEFFFGTDAAAFLPAPGGGRIGSVLLEDGREIPAQVVVAGKGVRPRAGLVAGAGGQVRRGIVVDPYLKTSLPDVYAAGDCAEVPDVQTGLPVPSG